MRFTFFLVFLSLFAVEGAWGFGKKPVSPKDPEDPGQDVIRARWEDSQRDGGKWSQYVFDQLPVHGKDLLAKSPSDMAAFCPNYKNLKTQDKKNFWVYFVSTLTQFESGHRPEVSFQESFNDSHGNPVISRGLLQLSRESGNGYGCGFASEQDLHDPYQNLDCGIRILNRWIGGDGVISAQVNGAWRGGARYWSVLRRANQLSSIRAWNKAQDICLVR